MCDGRGVGSSGPLFTVRREPDDIQSPLRVRRPPIGREPDAKATVAAASAIPTPPPSMAAPMEAAGDSTEDPAPAEPAHASGDTASAAGKEGEPEGAEARPRRESTGRKRSAGKRAVAGSRRAEKELQRRRRGRESAEPAERPARLFKRPSRRHAPFHQKASGSLPAPAEATALRLSSWQGLSSLLHSTAVLQDQSLMLARRLGNKDRAEELLALARSALSTLEKADEAKAYRRKVKAAVRRPVSNRRPLAYARPAALPCLSAPCAHPEVARSTPPSAGLRR